MIPTLTDVSVIKEILGSAGVEPKHSAGQNFLICSEVIEATLTAIEGGPQNVTELGSGLGVLTQALAVSGYDVRGIEKDDVFVDLLPKHIPAKLREHVEIIHADLKDVAWEWDTPYYLVGNIPYNLSGYIIRRMTQLDPAPTRVILLVQKEVGQRIVAGVPDMSLLSLAVSLWGKADRILNVPPSCFWPQPTVSSSLILLEPSVDAAPNREEIMTFAKPFFQNKRKQMGGTLRRAYSMEQNRAEELLKSADIAPTARPQEVSPRQWISLSSSV